MSEREELRIALGTRIRNMRTHQGLTGKRLSELTEISPAYLSEVERGLSDISTEKLTRIAQALSVSVQTLLSDKVEPQEKNREIVIPVALRAAAEELKLSLSDTIKILQGAQSLTARRSTGGQKELSKEDWMKFYQQVQFLLSE